jgi:hypothetical protein
MSGPPAWRPSPVTACIFLAATTTTLVSIAHGWRTLGIVAAAVVLAVMWETRDRQRQEGACRPRHRDRPWKQDPE